MSEAVHDDKRLRELQALPLERKIQITQARILEWNKHYDGKIVVSFSGGKDSTVLLDLVRRAIPDAKAVFSNTGLEYFEIQKFVYQTPNVDVIRPKLRFDGVISTYGYPLIGKEVAEAIYYARKIRSQSCNVERERERERAEQADANGQKWPESGQTEKAGTKDSRIPQKATGEMTSPSTHTHTHKAASGTARSSALGASKMLETDRRRDNLSGKLHGRDWKSGGGRPHGLSRRAARETGGQFSADGCREADEPG